MSQPNQTGEQFINQLDQHAKVLNYSHEKQPFEKADELYTVINNESAKKDVIQNYISCLQYTSLIEKLFDSKIWAAKEHEHEVYRNKKRWLCINSKMDKLRTQIISTYNRVSTKVNNKDNNTSTAHNTTIPSNVSISVKVIIAASMISEFTKYAMSNTNKNIETGGILLGSKLESNNTFIISHILLPKQSGTANAVYFKNENEWAQICDTLSLMLCGWIHTHPKQTCFMSSVDLHTQFNMETMNGAAVGIVVAPTDCVEIFHLTSYGAQLLSTCNTNGHHIHTNQQNEDISELLYQKANNIIFESSIQCIFMDIRNSHPLQVLCIQIDDIHLLTVRNPWAFFLKEGHKVLENKHYRLNSDTLNKPIALNVSGTPYTKQEMHEIYCIPVVQKYLKLNVSTKAIWNKPKELDKFFGAMKSQVIAIVTICQVLKNNSDVNLSQYEFASVPKKTNFVWIVGQCLPLTHSVPCRAGSLNVTLLGNEHRQILVQIKHRLKNTVEHSKEKGSSHSVENSEEKDNSNNSNTSFKTTSDGIKIGEKYDIYNKGNFKIINVKVNDTKIVCNENWYKIKYKIKNKNKCCWVSKDRFMLD